MITRILLSVFALSLSPAFAETGNESGGGGSSDQYADSNILLIASQLATGLEIVGGEVQGVPLKEIAQVVRNPEISPNNVTRIVDGRTRLLMLDYDREKRKIVVLPPLVSMMGLKELSDLSRSELKNARLSLLHEAAHIPRIGASPDGSDDFRARSFANAVYERMKQYVFVCDTLNSSSPAEYWRYAINPATLKIAELVTAILSEPLPPLGELGPKQKAAIVELLDSGSAATINASGLNTSYSHTSLDGIVNLTPLTGIKGFNPSSPTAGRPTFALGDEKLAICKRL